MYQENREDIDEVNLFLKKLVSFGLNDECILIFNDLNKSKVVSSHFVVRFKYDFSLKVLKKYGLYNFTFFSGKIDYERIDSFLERDCFIDFFDVLCEKNPNVKSGIESYYPENFESTECFREYYCFADSTKKTRHYGLKLNNAIKFIKDNYKLIESMVSHNN